MTLRGSVTGHKTSLYLSEECCIDRDKLLQEMNSGTPHKVSQYQSMHVPEDWCPVDPHMLDLALKALHITTPAACSSSSSVSSRKPQLACVT